ncbi:unnamed protein product [Pleuronectes platessa]|uniref:Uncharacterized protein n=1 Tax=Pleuronectes platessa TaxID=8262 RepID=A0A9N7ZD31_PLEPL|nr:unnamed protein product [Pleuronectes platessa]
MKPGTRLNSSCGAAPEILGAQGPEDFSPRRLFDVKVKECSLYSSGSPGPGLTSLRSSCSTCSLFSAGGHGCVTPMSHASRQTKVSPLISLSAAQHEAEGI